MAFASCQSCRYECRVADHLSDKHIRCPKCRAVVRVVSSLSDTVALMPIQTEEEITDPADLYVGSMAERRGPLSRAQLAMLAKWNLIDVNQVLSDELAVRRSTVKAFLENDGWPSERSRSDSGVNVPVTSGSSDSESAWSARAPLPPYVDDEPPAQIVYDEFGRAMMPDEFKSLLARAVQMEKQAQSVEIERPVSSAARYAPDPSELFVRSRVFRSGYSQIAILYALNAVIFCMGTTATAGLLLKRLMQLCASVFVPFESTAEVIEGEPLLLAGTALVFLVAQILVPLILLYRDDCVLWHCAAATFLGLLAGMVLRPEWVGMVFMVVRGSCFAFGLLICGIALWMNSETGDADTSAKLLIPVFITAFFVVALTVVDVSSLYIIRLTELSPRVRGTGLHVAVFALSLFVIHVAIPALFCSCIYSHAKPSVREFVNTQLIVTAAIAVLGGACLPLLVFPVKSDFLGIPAAMMPLVCANFLAVRTAPILWLLDPDYSLERN